MTFLSANCNPFLNISKHQKMWNSVTSGDFNIDLLKLKEKPKFYQFYDSHCTLIFIPKINLPTRLGTHTATLIDNCYCNLSIECFTSPTYIITTQISDHLPYIMILNASKANISPPKYIQTNNINTRTMLNFKAISAISSLNISWRLKIRPCLRDKSNVINTNIKTHNG